MAINQLPDEVHDITIDLMNALEGRDLAISVLSLINSIAFLIQQMPEENHEDILTNSTDMLMTLLGFIQIDPEELANATRH